jgi:hypothetical protein
VFHAGLELKDTRRLDIFPISPFTFPLLFTPKYTGSLYSIISITVLSILNPTTTIGALIPIIEVIDLAKDRSGVQRKHGKSGIIYLWTHKETGKQYVGSTINAYSRFANSYNSPSYLSRSRTPFNSALLLYGFEAFYVTILEVLPPYKTII